MKSPEVKEKARKLWMEGLSLRAVAKATGVTLTGIRYWRDRDRWALSRVGDQASYVMPWTEPSTEGYEIPPALRGPGVYVWRTSRERTPPSYVGMTSQGLNRPLSPDHHIKPGPDDRLTFYPCPTSEIALLIEGILIQELRPLRNRSTRSIPSIVVPGSS